MINKKGFTLIELLVVISIIGLLSTLAVVALGSARAKSRDAKRVTDIRQVQTALELYYADNNEYPDPAAPVILGNDTDGACLNATGFMASAGCTAPYMAVVPSDPGTTAYTYTVSGTTWYTLAATLEGNVGNLVAGAITATPNGVSN